MFDIGWSEMLVVGVVALIVVGPKDLPKMFHTLGEITGKARGMAREFQRAMDAAARETGVNDIVKDFKRQASGQGLKEASGLDDIEKELRDIGHDLPGVRKAGTKSNPTMPPKANAKPGADAKAAPAGTAPAEPDESAGDEADAEALAARNAKFNATEEERIKRQKKAEAARIKAAEIRARREADEVEAAARESGARESGPRESETREPAKREPARSAPAPETQPPSAQQPES